MNTSELEHQMKDLECFEGVYASDRLPMIRINHRPIGIILNTDKSSEPGQHWVALFIDENNFAEYFDSFGLNSLTEEICSFLKLNRIKSIYCNRYQLQAFDSISCGAFCIMYLKLRCNSFSFIEFIRLFQKDLNKNDLIVEKFIV